MNKIKSKVIDNEIKKIAIQGATLYMSYLFVRHLKDVLIEAINEELKK